MDASTVLRVCSLAHVRRAMSEGGGSNGQLEARGGSVLVGTLRVAEHSETYTHTPFRIPCGSVVFRDHGTRDEIRCVAVGASATWFGSDTAVLLTEWRYVVAGSRVRGPTADAWSVLEVAAAPVLLAAGAVPTGVERPLSWWVKRRVFPELALEEQFLADVRRGKDGGWRSVLGRVRAVGPLMAAADGSDGVGFLAEVAGGSGPVAVLLRGRRFLGLFASLGIGDVLFVSDVRARRMDGVDGVDGVLGTSDEARAYRVDEFEGLGTDQIEGLGEIEDVQGASQIEDMQGTDQTPSQSQALTQPRGLVSYAGVVTRVVDAALGLYEVDGRHVLALTFWPSASGVAVLRAGTRVVAGNVHVILVADSANQRWELLRRVWPRSAEPRQALVFAACARTSVRVVGFDGGAELLSGGADLIGGGADLLGGVVRAAGGVARLLAVLDAFCKLQAKFPGAELPAAAAMRAALQLTGTDVTLSPHLFPQRRSACAEFLDHAQCATGGGEAAAAARIVPLADVVRRFGAWQARQAAEATPHVRVAYATPRDLGLGGVALVARLRVGARGSVALEDATGRMLVQPTDGGGGGDALRPAFVGQMAAGHVCAWREWRVVSESAHVAGAPPLALVYAAVAAPAVLHADRRFSCGAEPCKPRAASSLLLFVHSRAAHVALQGAALRVDSAAFHDALRRREPLAVAADAPLTCVVSSGADAPHVSLVPGAAYVVCADAVAVAGGVARVVLTRSAYVHPVCAAVWQSAACVFETAGVVGVGAAAVRVAAADAGVVARLRAPHVHAVRDLGVLAAGSVVSVAGTVARRTIKRAVALGDPAGGNQAAVYETHIVLSGGGCSVAVFASLPSFAHPLGLVPGARFAVRDAVLCAARASGRPYLQATGATALQELAAPEPAAPEPAAPSQPAGPAPPRALCIAQLRRSSARRVALHCRVDAVELLRVSAACRACRQPVSALACACAALRHTTPASVAAAAVDVQCRVSDGSGVARLAVSDAAAMAAALGLAPPDVDALLLLAARSPSGCVCWTPQAGDSNADADADADADGAAAFVARAVSDSAALLVEGGVDAPAPPAARLQPLRLAGRTLVVRHPPLPLVTVRRALRLSTPALARHLLERLTTLRDQHPPA